MNAKMPELKKAFEAAGFTDVKTVLSSGNVVFSAPKASEASLQKKAESAMKQHLGQAFVTIVRPVDALREMLESDPYRAFRLPGEAKRTCHWCDHVGDDIPIRFNAKRGAWSSGAAHRDTARGRAGSAR